MRSGFIAVLAFVWLAVMCASAREIRVVVALADNQHQGILPVPEKIGNGDDPANNLYWGCSEALVPVLRASTEWKAIGRTENPAQGILERRHFRHVSSGVDLVVDGYRGREIKRATTDFFGHLTGNRSVDDLEMVVYVGHDGLMDFALPEEAVQGNAQGRAAIVLCCKSQAFFGPLLEKVQARPVLTTTQLMYPGGFIVKAALDGWLRRETSGQVVDRAARSYAANQKISVKSARGVFAGG